MKKNRIAVFNRVTSGGELDDASVFESLVGDHYEHFCYLYNIIAENGFIDFIDDIKCKIQKDRIQFKIRLNISFDDALEKQLNQNVMDASLGGLETLCENHGDKELVISVSGDEIPFFEP